MTFTSTADLATRLTVGFLLGLCQATKQGLLLVLRHRLTDEVASYTLYFLNGKILFCKGLEKFSPRNFSRSYPEKEKIN